jgi:hypothetical protein
MEGTNLDPFWALARTGEAELTREELRQWPPANVELLTRMGVLRPTRTATHALCTECPDGHVEEVIRLDHQDKTGFFIGCPEHGRVEVSPERLAQVAPDWNALAAWLAGGLGAKGTPEAVVPGALWRLGRVALGGKSRDAWCVRAYQGLQEDFAAKMPSTTGSVVFTFGTLAGVLLPQLPADHVIPLEEVVSQDSVALVLNLEEVEARVSGAVRDDMVSRKVRKKRAQRAAVVDALKRELNAHILSAQSHAKNLERQDREPELLPRPTQKALAKYIHASESAVSRALKEKEPYLKVLWETANDLDAVRKYKAR